MNLVPPITRTRRMGELYGPAHGGFASAGHRACREARVSLYVASWHSASVQPSDHKMMRPPGRGVVARSLTIAALWSMVAALAAAVVVLVAGLVSAAVVGVAWLVSSGQAGLADTAVIWRVATVTTWIVGILAIGLAVWVAAYASTEWGSRSRALAGSAAAGLAMVAYLLLGSSGLVVAGLGLGWAVAIPAERISRVSVRGIAVLLVSLLAPGFDSVSGAELVLLLALSPWVAAALVWLVDGAWVLLARTIVGPTGT